MGRASYYPFGEVYTSSGVLHTDRMFTGQRLDETGLYYYGARYVNLQPEKDWVPLQDQFSSSTSLQTKDMLAAPSFWGRRGWLGQD